MKVKDKHGNIGHSEKFNTHTLNEVIVCFNDNMDSLYIKELKVYLEFIKRWKSMSAAFRDKDLIPDNYNTWFREPKNEEEKERGWF